MIEKIPFETEVLPYKDKTIDVQTHASPYDLQIKINELVDAVNNQQIQLNNHMCRLMMLEHTEELAEEPTDPYAEQKKWIGKLCWFWDVNKEAKSCGILTKIAPENHDYKGQICPYLDDSGDGCYMHCEPVKPDDDIIYKGE